MFELYDLYPALYDGMPVSFLNENLPIVGTQIPCKGEMMVQTIEILLVEDNEGDVFLTKRAFEKAKIANNIQVANDGEIALDMLTRKSGYEGSTRPHIVLLDINLPKKDGTQVLSEIRNNPDLKRIPVVILTSSQAERDVLKTYDLAANSYIIKPLTLNKFNDIVSAIENFWFNIVILPPK